QVQVKHKKLIIDNGLLRHRTASLRSGKQSGVLLFLWTVSFLAVTARYITVNCSLFIVHRETVHVRESKKLIR
ncbi:MAG: hypothetical protein LBV47_08220, partial [Bacteroidales bacterium]|nr:hypothetical protein [Bacteroidales bacterium]